jgi:hypothetical protein
MTRVAVDYKPSGPVARRFLRSPAFIRGIKGPIGSGKSVACCMEIMLRACQQAPDPDGRRRTRFAIIRNTFPELRTTTIKTWHAWFPREVGGWRDSGPPCHTIKMERDDGTVVELEVLFIALDTPDDVRKLLSLELTGAWINEAREVPKAILDGLTGRVGRFPDRKNGGPGPTWRGVLMDTNPPDVDHWWYRAAEERNEEALSTLQAELVGMGVIEEGQPVVEYFNQPPGDGPDAENLENLPAGYYQLAKVDKGEDWISVYVRGKYGFVNEGKPVFPEWIDALHASKVPLAPVRGVPIWIGVDFGLTPAALIAQRTVTGRWLILDELVSEDMGAKKFGELLGAKIRRDYPEWLEAEGAGVEGWGDPAGDARSQADDEVTPFSMLRASSGLDIRPAPSNDIVLRLEAVRAALTKLSDGKPVLLVSPKARVFRKGMAGAYRYKRLARSSDTFADKPEKGSYSHVCDAGQYLFLGAGEARVLVRSPKARTKLPGVADGGYDYFGGGR